MIQIKNISLKIKEIFPYLWCSNFFKWRISTYVIELEYNF